jgi:hypothetical protein
MEEEVAVSSAKNEKAGKESDDETLVSASQCMEPMF